mgnify:CR=1 FL=1
MNTPIGYFGLHSYFVFFILILFSLFSFFLYTLNFQSSHFILLSLHSNFSNSNGYLYTSLGHLYIIVPSVYNNLYNARLIELPYNYIKYKHRLIYSTILRFTYAALMFACCFFYLIMTGNNLSVIALSVGGNGPPINPKN